MALTTISRQAAGPANLEEAGALTPDDTVAALSVAPDTGLSTADAALRLARWGPNAVSTHKARLWAVLWHQLRSPLLVLLVGASAVSYGLGERSDAVIIGAIVALSVGLGFGNEYRAEKAAEALHDQLRHLAVVLRDGCNGTVDVTELVPGDIVELRLGDVVPADLRLLSVADLECEESLLTGESLPVAKSVAQTSPGTALAELSSCALAGTIVHSGSGRGVVVATGPRTVFGGIAVGLSTHPLDTEFQIGLRRFSMMLVYVGGALTGTILS